jgi:hypothetical protein
VKPQGSRVLCGFFVCPAVTVIPAARIMREHSKSDSERRLFAIQREAHPVYQNLNKWLI